MERIVVAAAGDMAYEFGRHHVRWDSPAGERAAIDGSYVQVWRKRDGNWCVEVSFARPDQPGPGSP